MGGERIRRKREQLDEMMSLLYGFLGDEQRSMSDAAKYLKEAMGEIDYRTAFIVSGISHLSEAVKLFDDMFELVRGNYYVRTV